MVLHKSSTHKSAALINMLGNLGNSILNKSKEIKTIPELQTKVHLHLWNFKRFSQFQPEIYFYISFQHELHIASRIFFCIYEKMLWNREENDFRIFFKQFLMKKINLINI